MVAPYEDETFIGSMINENFVEKAKSWIQNAINEGASVLCGSVCKDLMFEPTFMIDVTEEMNIVCEEVFASIVSLIHAKEQLMN